MTGTDLENGRVRSNEYPSAGGCVRTRTWRKAPEAIELNSRSLLIGAREFSKARTTQISKEIEMATPTQPIGIPMHVRMVRLSRLDDCLFHSVEFGIAGTKQPAKVIVRSEMFSSPQIEERIDRGGIDLSDTFMDTFAIGCFSIMSGFIIDYDGDCGTWTSQDATRWLRSLFNREDAEIVLRALSRHVTKGLHVQDQVIIGDDDVVLANDYSNPSPSIGR